LNFWGPQINGVNTQPNFNRQQSDIVFDNKGVTRGHQWRLEKKRCNSDLRQHFFSERVVNMWNNLYRQACSVSNVCQLFQEQITKDAKQG